MRLFTPIFTFIVITVLFGIVLNKIKIIEQLQEESNIQSSFYKDTIQCQKDTIQYQKDTIYYQQEYYKNILDSLPLGSPLDTLSVTSNFGSRKNKKTQKWEYHPGIDFLADWRDTIYATGHGIIEISHYNSGYGRTILIDHGSGYKSRYAHLTRYFVKRGDTIKKGEAIGIAGNTGNSRGYHLHYEVSRYGKLTDPKEYLPTQDTARSNACH